MGPPTSRVIRPMVQTDWASVARIYEEGIRTGQATFEKEVPTWDIWDSTHDRRCRLVAAADESMLAWAALSPVSARFVYRGVGEVSIYVGQSSRGLGVGSELLAVLVEKSESAGFWTLQAGVFPENEASIRLHEQNGFRRLGVRERVGQMDGRWRDVLVLERRSQSVGRDEPGT